MWHPVQKLDTTAGVTTHAPRTQHPASVRVSDGVHLHLVVVGHQRGGLALQPLRRVVGAVLEEDARRAQGHNDALVLAPEVLVQHAVHDGVKAAVEVGHEVARYEEPLGDEGHHRLAVDGHRQADQVQRRPAHGEEHKHNEHGDEVPDVVRRQLGPVVWLDPPAHLDDQDPDAQVAVRDDHDGQDEVEEDHGDGVRRAGRLLEGAGVDARVVLQRAHKQVGHDGHHGQRPDQQHVAHRVLVAVQLVVLEAVADVAVAVQRDAGDVEDGADDADAHQEAADLAVDVAQVPAVVEDGGEHQRVGVDGYH